MFFFLFQFFDLVKNAKKPRGQKKECGTCKTRYPSGSIKYFEVKIIRFRTPLDFFNVINLEHLSIGHPFTFEIAVFNVISRGTEGPRK